jgi:outer membrane protein assembly factor BamD
MRLPTLTFLAVAGLAVIGLTSGACGGDGYQDPILKLSAEESLEQGKALLEQEKYMRAREFLLHAFEVAPNSATGREALLLVADAHFLDGGSDNFIKAEAKYRDFQNRFPTSDRSAYVQFQIANSLAKRMLKPDRDQAATYKALEAYNDLLRIYPTSEYVSQAEEQIRVVKNNLAESEFLKGYFHMRSMRLPNAAIRRFERVLEDYPDFDQMDKVMFYLGRAYERAEEADKAREIRQRLRQEYPQSPLIAKLRHTEVEAG